MAGAEGTQPTAINGAHIEHSGALTRLTIPPASSAVYTDAQLDDYDHPARHFSNRAPRKVHIRARFSHPVGALKGTAGFGFWNHPFTQDGGLVAPPATIWFFYASPESDLRVAPGKPGHGFKAATLDSLPLATDNADQASAASGGWLTHAILAAGNLALRLPLLSRLALGAAQRIVRASEAPLNLDLTAWHDFGLDWERDTAIFYVDGREVLRAPKPPRGPLGFVAWIDNYYAKAAGGQYAFGYVDVPEAQWLEISSGP